MNASAKVTAILTWLAARTQGQTTRSVFLKKIRCFLKRNPISPLVAGRKCTIKTLATFFICHNPPLFLFQFLRRQLMKASHEKIELSTHESKSWENWYYLNIARYLLKQKFLWVKELRCIKHCTGMSVCKVHKMYGKENPYLLLSCFELVFMWRMKGFFGRVFGRNGQAEETGRWSEHVGHYISVCKTELDPDDKCNHLCNLQFCLN